MATVISKTSVKIDELLADVVVNAQVVDGYLIVTTRNGSQINAGTVGGDGTAWYSGNGAPAGSSYAIGDFYLDQLNGDFYSKTGATTWVLRGNLKGGKGDKGDPGTNGTNGTLWYTGVGGPAPTLGAINDFYLDEVNGDYHKKVATTTWQLEGNLKGDQGIQGEAGTLIPITAEPDPEWPDGTVFWDTDELPEEGYLWDAIATWAPGVTYTYTSPVSVVTYNGETWIAVANSTGETPGSGSSWKKLAAKGAQGDPGTPAPTTFDASAIVSGTFATARIPNLDAAKITTGSIDYARMGNVVIRLAWTGSAWPARPAGVYAVDWISPVSVSTAPPWTSTDTWTQY